MAQSQTGSVAVPAPVLSTEVEGEVVLLNLESGQYYSLDGTGARMWALLTQHGQLEPAIAAMLDEYDVDKERLRRDMLHLIDELVMHGLLHVDLA
jgi:Coenzyme PQQ synthesis protein D (PqqD)